MASYCKSLRRTFLIRRVSYKIIVLLGLIILLSFTSIFTGSRQRHVTEQELRKYKNVHFQEKEVKRILYWQPHIGENIGNTENTCLKKCPVKCESTDDINEIANVDAVDFHLSNLWTKVWRIGTRSTIQFPTYRRPDQVWIVSNMEPPQHLWGDLKVFNGVFNWTRWYRSDATLGWYYGFPHKLNEAEIVNATKLMKGRNIFKEKTKGIMGRISNCVDQNKRYKTIHAMKKYVDIDMFGLCYNKPCGKPSDQWDKSCDVIMKQYKFYLAFENNDCKDYVTEKYWFALERDQIPIVNWKSLDKSIVIPNSYINIYDFKDIKSATDFIKKVSENETLYNSYFDWKMRHSNYPPCPSCDICKALHDRERPAQVIEDFDGWVRNDICDKVGVGDVQLSLFFLLFLHAAVLCFGVFFVVVFFFFCCCFFVVFFLFVLFCFVFCLFVLFFFVFFVFFLFFFFFFLL